MSQNDEPSDDVAGEVGQALSAVHSILSRMINTTNLGHLRESQAEQLETIKRVAARLSQA